MKILCTKRDLHEGVATAGRVAGKSTLPILMNVLVRTQEGGMEIVGSDMEIWIRRRLPAQVQEEGAFTASARLATEIVNALPDSHVQIVADGQGSVTLTCERSSFDLVGLPADQYPSLPQVGDDRKFTMKAGDLRVMIQQVAFAASSDEARAIMTGINMILKDGRVTMAATDGHRLAVRHMACESLTFEATAIIPARALNELARTLPAEDDADVQIRVDRNQVQFDAGNTTLITRLIDGQFPNYERVVPASSDKSITAQTAEISQAVRRAGIVAREASNRIILRTDGERLLVTAESGAVGRAKEDVEVIREGDDVEIAFNAKYLQDVLNILDSEGVRFELTGSLNPGLVRPVDTEDYLYVIMPMQIV
ncbi:MAG TPA: DNA polymerase III subunit beta [Armatimonadota bacterium]|jgi:DNA polymerase-3 subunit beta